ncbi:unnamed protein product [Lactuca saligna]|uniref:Retrotransposon Copia-like N-terminal domain-containing protein n=1 Tax=Lactuca saligna TaxID=75948 RepID=A0AA35ZIG7_LACSI|nr:unnamed protein product [Lactuca saligna]
MENSSYSSNPHVTLEVREENPYINPYPYPYPSHVCAHDFLSLKLSDRDEYGIWKTQMLCLLESHDMLGFIDGTLVSPYEASSSSSSVFGKEKVVDYQPHHKLWRRSDALVKGWILGSLSKETLGYVLEHLTGKLHQEDFSAKDVWDELQTMYRVAVLPQLPPFGEDTLQDQDRAKDLERLYGYTQKANWNGVEEILRQERVTVMDKITNNGNTTLHVAVGTSKDGKFFEKLLERIPQKTQKKRGTVETGDGAGEAGAGAGDVGSGLLGMTGGSEATVGTVGGVTGSVDNGGDILGMAGELLTHLLDVTNSDGSTLLHVAAIIGNTKAADILVRINPDLLLAKDKEGQNTTGLGSF